MKRNLIAISILINFDFCIPANGQNDGSGYGWIDESLEIETSITMKTKITFTNFIMIQSYPHCDLEKQLNLM